jgi:polar amino acid transport system substrate-binding protein
MTKPIRRGQLKETLTALVSSRPTADAPESPVSPHGKPGKALPRPARDRHGPYILVAEDNPSNQTVIRLQLEKLGYTADFVSNGREALERLGVARPAYDLVLMDVQMPEMDGLQATRLHRKAEGEGGAHIPIIAMTAQALKGDREKCLDAGMDDYISKPVRLERLREALDLWLPDPGAGQHVPIDRKEVP